MSQTTQPAPHEDAYIAAQKAPAQDIKIETYKGGAAVRLLTPVGRLSFCHFDKPMPKQVNGSPVFSTNLLLHPSACEDIWRAIIMLADAHYQARHEIYISDDKGIVKLKQSGAAGGGIVLHTPMKHGDYMYAVKPEQNSIYRGLFYMNPSSAADKPPVCVDETGAPMSPGAIYSGCYGRLWIEIATISDKPGHTKGVTAYLRSVQFAKHGDRLQGNDNQASAAAAFASSPLPSAGPAPLGAMTPGGVAPAASMALPSGAAPWAPPSTLR